MRIQVRQKNAAMVKISSNGDKQCIPHKAYGSYGKFKKSSKYSDARMRHTQNQRSACTLQRIATVTHDSNITLRRSTKETNHDAYMHAKIYEINTVTNKIYRAMNTALFTDSQHKPIVCVLKTLFTCHNTNSKTFKNNHN